jgi:hypothetical protein
VDTTAPNLLEVACARADRPPHPPFGHLLPSGEKGTVYASAERGVRRGAIQRSPSPQRGERRGEGPARWCSARSLQRLPEAPLPAVWTSAPPPRSGSRQACLIRATGSFQGHTHSSAFRRKSQLRIERISRINTGEFICNEGFLSAGHHGPGRGFSWLPAFSRLGKAGTESSTKSSHEEIC